MRKFYALLTGALFCLVCNLSAQTTVTPDVANFTFTVNAASNDVVFTNTSVLGNAPGNRKAFWHFGDGSVTQTGPLQGTQHHYQSGGTYTVCLKIYRYGFNTNDSVLTASECRTITLQSVATCTANFESPGTTPTGGPGRYFVAQPGHSQNKKPVRICWNFGDGRDTCIQYPASYTGSYGVYHLYSNPGNYNVCVSILYDGGCQATKCKIVEVSGPDSCRANFERIELATTNNPLNATFKALPWHSNNKKPVYICWSFGDNRDTCIQYSNTFSGPYTVNHTYSQPGVYNVCVRIVYQGGCDARKCENIRIGRPDSCSADFERLGLGTTAGGGLTQIFKAIPGHNNNKKPARICWTFGDGRDTCIDYLNIYNGQYTVAHTYSQPGQYEVCVKIIYQGGCEARKCRVVSVPPPDACAADFERIPVASTNNPLHTYFKALPSHNNNKKPARICWTFGDGSDTCITYPETYTGVYGVSHQYTQPGNYEVCVKINYYGGCEARKCRVVTILRPDSCGADFERIPVTTTPNALQTYFKALPSHNNNKKPARICWNFGDGRDTCINYPETFSGVYAVSHQYTQPGNYEVCVKITYFGGCEARKCRVITIPPPQPACSVNLFEITPSISSLNRGFLAVPHTDPPRRVERICWNFGDGTDTCINFTPNQPSPDLGIRHNYPGPGIYRACVRITFEGGCVAEKCIEVVIRGHNNTNLCGGYMTDSLTGPRTVKFKGFSIANPNDEVLYYRWTFGDGTTGIGREITHQYATSGEFRVCLSIKTRSGCETNICKTVRIPGPNQATLVLTPNPVITVLNAIYLSTHTEPVTIRIMNGFGTAVRTYTRNAVTGANTWTFDLAALIPGIYTFIVQSPNQLASAIFIKN